MEAMALGKPVIAYLRAGDLHFVAPEMREELPIIHATPQTIFEVLHQWLTARREQLSEVGARSRRFVERWHDPVQIAKRTKADYVRVLRQKRLHRKSAKSELPTT